MKTSNTSANNLLQSDDGWRSNRLPRLLIAITAVFVLEVFLFNYGFWSTCGLEPKTVTEGNSTELTQGTIEIELEEPINIFTLSAVSSAPAMAEIEFVDEGHAAFYGTERWLNPHYAKGRVFSVHPYGKVSALRISVMPDAQANSSADEEVTIKELVVNEPLPFCFSWPRVIAILFCVLFLFIFDYKSALFARTVSERSSRVYGAAVTAFICLALSASCIVGSGWFGYWGEGDDGAWSYHPSQPHLAQYAEQARALASGSTSLLVEPPSFLSGMENPYDYKARLQAQSGSGEEAPLWDTAYKDGAYYSYFGVLPVVVFYLPYYLLTGTDCPDSLVFIIMLLTFCVIACWLVWVLAIRFYPRTKLGVCLLTQIGVVFSSMLAFGCRCPTIYTLPALMSMTLLALGFVVLLRARRPLGIVLASLSWALILACRPQIFLFATVGIACIVAMVWRENGHHYALARVLPWIALPVIVVALLLFVYNYLRFGSFLDFGASYNLTGNDMTHRPFSPAMCLIALFYNFIQLPALSPTFPFIAPTDVSPDYVGWITKEDMFGGMFWIAPFLFFALTLLWDKNRSTRGLVSAVLVSAVVVSVFDTLAAGLLSRYYLDYAFPLAVLASIAFMRWMDMGTRNVTRKALLRLALASVLISIFFFVGVLFTPYYVDAIGDTYLYYSFLL